jgi:hypothetical protein
MTRLLRRGASTAATTIALTALLAGPVGAQEIPNDASAVAPVASLTLSAFMVLVLTSLLIPAVTGLITKSTASATVKQLVTLAVSALNGLVVTSTQSDGTALISATTAQYALLSLGIAIVSYLGIYKPHDLNNSRALMPDIGIGPAQDE